MHRRAYLAAAGGLGLGSIAGCLDSLPEPIGEPSVQKVKENAEQIDYDELHRNIGSYEGEYVHYPRGQITDIPSPTDTKKYVISLPGGGYASSRLLWGVWDGNPFRETDTVELWGVVDGLKEYPAIGGPETVPKLTLVSLELLR